MPPEVDDGAAEVVPAFDAGVNAPAPLPAGVGPERDAVVVGEVPVVVVPAVVEGFAPTAVDGGANPFIGAPLVASGFAAGRCAPVPVDDSPPGVNAPGASPLPVFAAPVAPGVKVG